MATLLSSSASATSVSLGTPFTGRPEFGILNPKPTLALRTNASPSRNLVASSNRRASAVALTSPTPGKRTSSVAARATAWGPLAPLVELLSRQGGGPGKEEEREALKEQLLEAILPVKRGVAASETQKEEIEELASRVEALNPTPAALKSPLLNGKWKLLYTTSASILGANNPIPFLRPWGPIFQCIDTDSLSARNLQSWPFFNSVEAELTPVSKSRVDVRFTEFKILNLIAVKAPQRDGPPAYLDTTYLDDELRISRGNLGNLFVLTMDDASYRIEGPEE